MSLYKHYQTREEKKQQIKISSWVSRLRTHCKDSERMRKKMQTMLNAWDPSVNCLFLNFQKERTERIMCAVHCRTLPRLPFIWYTRLHDTLTRLNVTSSAIAIYTFSMQNVIRMHHYLKVQSKCCYCFWFVCFVQAARLPINIIAHCYIAYCQRDFSVFSRFSVYYKRMKQKKEAKALKTL